MRSNPFATRFVRPGELAWIASTANKLPAGEISATSPTSTCPLADDSPATLAQRFHEALESRGAIVGPHGAGKSTLLEHLKPLLRGEQISLSLRRGERPFRSVCNTTSQWTQGGVLILDGFEQLSTLQAIRVCWKVRRSRMGLLATCHRRSRLLPTLVEIAPTAQLLQQLVVQRLAADDQLSQADRQRWTDLGLLQQWLTQEQGSVREVFMRLYDCYEDSRPTQTG